MRAGVLIVADHGGRDREIFRERDRKLEAARELRKLKRQRTYPATLQEKPAYVKTSGVKVHLRLRRNSTWLELSVMSTLKCRK